MTSDPYKTPDSDVSFSEELPQRPVVGIIAGFVVDIGGTVLGYVMVTFVYGIFLGATGGSVADIERLAANYEPYSPIGIILGVIGLAMSYIAGFVCAKVSRARDLKYPAILSTIVFIIGTIAAWNEDSILLLLFLGLLGFVATLMGARKKLSSDS